MRTGTRGLTVTWFAFAAALFSELAAVAPAAAQSSGVTVTINLNITATATVDTTKVQEQTKTAIRGLLSERAKIITSGGPDTQRMHERLNGGSLMGSSEATVGFAEDDKNKPATNARMSRQQPLDAVHGLGSVAAGSSFGNSGGGAPGGFGFGEGGMGSVDDDLGPSPRFGRGNERSGVMPFRFSGDAEGGTGRFAFATSLSQMRAAAEAKEREKLTLRGTPGIGTASEGEPPANGPVGDMSALGLASAARSASKQPVVDVWVEGRTAYFNNNRTGAHRQGHASLLYAGADVILTPGLLFGIMGQADWIADNNTVNTAITAGTTSTNTNLARDGRGWMAGPYLSMRLTPSLYLDARAAWGGSDNHVDPIGAYVDTFATSRSLAAAKLTGDWSWGQLRVVPSAEVIWFQETSDAYTNAIGIEIDKVSYNLGRFTFGPEIGYRLSLGEAGLLEPFIGVKGVWDFAKTAETPFDGMPAGNDGVTGRIEGGAVWRGPSGVSLRASGQYDGLGGSGFHAVQGKAQLVVPLQ